MRLRNDNASGRRSRIRIRAPSVVPLTWIVPACMTRTATVVPPTWIVPACMTVASVSVVAMAYLYLRLSKTERRLKTVEAEAARKEERAFEDDKQDRGRAAAGAQAMLSEWAPDGTTFVYAKDITDIIRGRRDPHSQWAAQKSKWPPQRMKFMARRFADGESKFTREALEALCLYMHQTTKAVCSDELEAAWEECERLRHKSGNRESLMPPQAPLMPVTQLREQGP